MNTDQRIDALTAKVEALFQFQAAQEANLDRLFELQAKNETMMASLIQGMADMRESILGLARIAQAHEQRISRLEEGRA